MGIRPGPSKFTREISSRPGRNIAYSFEPCQPDSLWSRAAGLTEEGRRYLVIGYASQGRRARSYRAQCRRSQEVGAFLSIDSRAQGVGAKPTDQDDVPELRPGAS